MLTHDDVTLLAERSLLGCLLVDATPFRAIDGYVRASDFTDPWHRHVWVAMREAAAAGAPMDTLALGTHMLRKLGGRVADLPRLHLLLHDAPTRPDPVPHARHVVESGVRREIAGQGVLLRATALEGSMWHEGGRVRAALRISGAAVIIAGERWADANGHTTDGLSATIPARLRAGAEDLELRRAAGKFLGDYPGVDRAEVCLHEQRLVASLVNHPTAISPTVAWMRPDQLINRPWATVYSALAQMAASGHHIDQTTVALETARVGRVTGSAPGLPAMLDAIEGERHSVPGHLRQFVAGDHLRVVAVQGAAALRDEAASPDTQVVELLETATAVLQRMDRLSTAFPDQIDVGPQARRGSLGMDPPTAPPAIEGPAAG